ncbi:MAG: AraC family transcriptional regulator [Alloacidobacterium sp.]
MPDRLLLIGPTSDHRHVICFRSLDFFKIHLPPEMLAECIEANFDRSPPSTVDLFEPHFAEDAVLKNLTRSLVNVDEDGGPLGPCFVDAVGLAITSHLIGRYSGRYASQREKAHGKLSKWRVRRVQEYVEAHVARPIYLSEMSAVVGLSRMHFAAQFRNAVGCSPHAYVLRRKIVRAQELLMDRQLSIIDVAAMVGFKSQAHFATVFRKIVGEPPARWRASAVS